MNHLSLGAAVAILQGRMLLPIAAAVNSTVVVSTVLVLTAVTNDGSRPSAPGRRLLEGVFNLMAAEQLKEERERG